MKIRTDFVTNSSSTSYVFVLKTPPEVTEKQLKHALRAVAKQVIPLIRLKVKGDRQDATILKWFHKVTSFERVWGGPQQTIWELKGNIPWVSWGSWDGTPYFKAVMHCGFSNPDWAIIHEEDPEG